MKNGVVSVVCGAMFGEERVNNSVDLLSRGLVSKETVVLRRWDVKHNWGIGCLFSWSKFSVGCFNSFKVARYYLFE